MHPRLHSSDSLSAFACFDVLFFIHLSRWDSYILDSKLSKGIWSSRLHWLRWAIKRHMSCCMNIITYCFQCLGIRKKMKERKKKTQIDLIINIQSWRQHLTLMLEELIFWCVLVAGIILCLNWWKESKSIIVWQTQEHAQEDVHREEMLLNGEVLNRGRIWEHPKSSSRLH